MFSSKAKERTAWNYYRHSAENKQENSVLIQSEKAHIFAGQHGINITLEIADEGKSGLSAKRPGFERLFNDYVLNPNIPKVDYILVNDVSRWGRFQDPDEAAYWTMLCKQQGIQVIYIEEGFPNEDQLLASSLQTQIKRYGAADFSRTLSIKVFNGSTKVTEQGYLAGGAACYGLTRVLLRENKEVERELKPGEHKVVSNQRVTLAPSNNEKSQAVRRMFDELKSWSNPRDIAVGLNNDGLLTEGGKQWNTSKVVRILSNERYAGTMVYNKTRQRLQSKSRHHNPISEWVRCEGAFEGIVTLEEFEIAQERLYWLMPSRHRYGIYKINAARREFKKYLREQTEHLHDDDKFKVLHEFPIAFGLTFYQREQAKRCFLIEDKHRAHQEVLCIGLDLFTKDKIDKAYKLPTRLFGAGDYLVVRDYDSDFQQYIVNTENTGTAIKEIYSTLTA